MIRCRVLTRVCRRCLGAQRGMQCWCGCSGEGASRRTNSVRLQSELLHVLQLLLHLLLHGTFFLILNRVQGPLFFGVLWMKRRFVASGGLLFSFLCCD